jgi:transcriptional regulator with XRE-family HTH domain
MKPKIHPTVGRRICQLRHEHGISQEKLAASLNAFHPPITRHVVANWETGRTEVPAYCIQLIACLLEEKIPDILPDLSFEEINARQTMEAAGSRRQNCQPAAPPT